jgi:NADH dehydrogenase [ubiquinone] 1 alpha subcomplex assembly factor 5
MTLFSPQTYSLHHKRAQKTFHEHAFLFDHVRGELLGRLQAVRRRFERVLDVSPYAVWAAHHCQPLEHYSGFPETLSLPDASFDLIVSCLAAHWVNDMPSFLSSIHRCLQPEGLFLGALWGGNTLHEVRESLLQAEVMLSGGASPRVAPMLQPSDAPLLLAHAGFSMVVVDTETITVTYPSLLAVMKDLRGMGEANKIRERVKGFSSRKLFTEAEEIYRDSFGHSDGKLPATFDVIYLTGLR